VDDTVPRPAVEPSNDLRESFRAGVSVLLLVPVAHFLALTHEWLYFPWDRIEELVKAGPLAGFYGPPILRGTIGFLIELLLAATLLAWLRRRLGIPWLRAIGDGALHLLPLGASAFVLFHDNLPARLMLFAGIIAGTVAVALFRVLPSPTPLEAPSNWPRRLAPVLAVLAATWFIALALLRHASYWSSVIDLGLFSGALHSTVNGGRMLYAPELGSTFLAEHFSPILLMLAPLFALFDDPRTLLVVQSLAVAGGGYLLYLWAEEILGDGWLALAIMASYLLAPDTFQSQWHDFHMDLLMPPMIFGALLALRRGKLIWFFVCVALLWCTKEDAFLYTALLGLYAAAAHRRWWTALATVAVSLFVGYALLEWILPHFRAQQDPGVFFRTTFNTGGGYKFMERYSHLGRSVAAVAKSVVTNPVYVLGHIGSEDRLASLLTITVPLGFAAFFGLAPLLLLAASGVMLLASHFYMNSLSFYYGAIPLAFAYAAGVVGLARASARLERWETARPATWAPRFRAAAVAWIVAATMTLLAIHPESVLSPVNERPRYLRTPRTRYLDEVVASIPSDVPLSAGGYVGVHLMDRMKPRMVPYGMDLAQWVVLDLYRPSWPLEGNELWFMAERLAKDPAWGVVRAERGVLVYRKGAERTKNELALRQLHELDLEPEEWESSAFSNLAVARDDASGGYALTVTPGDPRGPGLLFWGPFCALPPGEYEVEFRLAAEGDPARPRETVAGTIDVFRSGETLAKQDLTFAEFPSDLAWRSFKLRFRRTAADQYEFRVFYRDVGTLAVDVIRVRRVGD
jgi:uncharacterized membrane protein